jgi:hypothetical protein
MNTDSQSAMQPSAISDHEVIAEVLRGNREMFEVILRRHNQRLYRVTRVTMRFW